MPVIVAELENVSRLFGRFAALRQVSTAFYAGRCALLVGENGAGKSTLLRVLAGLLEPTLGKVRRWPEENGAPDGVAREERLRAECARVGYMSHAPMLYDELSGIENLRYFAGLYRSRASSPEEALRAVGLDPALARPVGQYSQGMRQRASLARVLLSQPELILLDEPFSNLDAPSASQMLSVLARLRDQGRSIVMTTHQRELAAPVADRILTMESGRLIHSSAGPAAEADERRPGGLELAGAEAALCPAAKENSR